MNVEELARKLHDWYLEATARLQPENYNPKAQRGYDELTEEQRSIDRYIATRIIESSDKGPEVDEEFVKEWTEALWYDEYQSANEAMRKVMQAPLLDMLREAGVRVKEET